MMTEQWEQNKADFKKKIKVIGSFTDKRKLGFYNAISYIKINNGCYDATDGFKLIRFKPDFESAIKDRWMDQDGNYLDMNRDGYPDFNRILLDESKAELIGKATRKEIKELITFINRSIEHLSQLKKQKQGVLDKYVTECLEFTTNSIKPFYCVSKIKFVEKIKRGKKTYKEETDFYYNDYIDQRYTITGDYSPFKGMIQGLSGKKFNLFLLKEVLKACMISKDDQFVFYSKHGDICPVMIKSQSEDLTMLLMPIKP